MNYCNLKQKKPSSCQPSFVFWPSNVKSDDVIEILKLEIHKDDTNVRALALIELVLWAFKYQLSAILEAILFFSSFNVNSDDIIDLDQENNKYDTNNRSVCCHRTRDIAIWIRNFRYICRHLSFWLSIVKYDDLVAFIDLENRKVDTNIRSPALIVHYVLTELLLC